MISIKRIQAMVKRSMMNRTIGTRKVKEINRRRKEKVVHIVTSRMRRKKRRKMKNWMIL